MKGAMAEPLVNTMRIPKNSKVRIMGSSQYFFRVLMKPHRSFKKSIRCSLLKWNVYYIYYTLFKLPAAAANQPQKLAQP
jgi:hypothetical protein